MHASYDMAKTPKTAMTPLSISSFLVTYLFFKKNFPFRDYTNVATVTQVSKSHDNSVLRFEDGHFSHPRVVDFDSEKQHFV